MTDEQIKKALECCRHDDYDYCEECPYRKNKPCQENLIQDCFDLINRLQADCENYKQVAENQQSVTMDRGFEIERLKNDLAISKKETKRYMTGYKTAKAEAYKEFAERLKENYEDYSDHSSLTVKMFCYDIDNLLKEMVGEDK